MGIRTGAQYLDGLRKHPREVRIRGQRVKDVTTHPAFAKPAAHIARLYDMQHDSRYRDVLTYTIVYTNNDSRITNRNNNLNKSNNRNTANILNTNSSTTNNNTSSTTNTACTSSTCTPTCSA